MTTTGQNLHLLTSLAEEKVVQTLGRKTSIFSIIIISSNHRLFGLPLDIFIRDQTVENIISKSLTL